MEWLIVVVALGLICCVVFQWFSTYGLKAKVGELEKRASRSGALDQVARDAIARVEAEMRAKYEEKLAAALKEMAAQFSTSAHLDVLSDKVAKEILSDSGRTQEFMRMLTMRVIDTDETIRSFVRRAAESMPNLDKLVAAKLEAVFEDDQDGEDSLIFNIVKEHVPELLTQMLSDPERRKAFWDAVSVVLLKRVDEFVDFEIDEELREDGLDVEECYIMNAVDEAAAQIVREEFAKPDGELRQKLIELLIRAMHDKVLDR